ncbi:MAG: hypothetical protein Q8O09_01040 [Bacillota bacterium]|nr:hypothetical protein [Bacillota bacterium]
MKKISLIILGLVVLALGVLAILGVGLEALIGATVLAIIEMVLGAAAVVIALIKDK